MGNYFIWNFGDIICYTIPNFLKIVSLHIETQTMYLIENYETIIFIYIPIMKKCTLLLASFLMCLGMLAQTGKPQAISEIGANVADLKTLQDGDWVLIKSMQMGEGYLYHDNSKTVDNFLFDNKTAVTVGATAIKFLWQVHKTATEGQLTFSSIEGGYVPALENNVKAKAVAQEQAGVFEVLMVTGKSNWCFRSVNSSTATIYAKAQTNLMGGVFTKLPTGGNGRANFQIFPVKVVDKFVPFIVSESTAAPVWQNIQMLRSRYWKYDTTADAVYTVKLLNEPEHVFFNNDEFKWCFVSDGADGYKVYNKAKGITFALGYDNQKDEVVFVNEAEAPVWYMAKGTDANYPGHCFSFDKSNTKFLNTQDKSGNPDNYLLKSWSQAGAASSCFFFVPGKQMYEYAFNYDVPKGTVGNYSYFNDAEMCHQLHKNMNALEKNFNDDATSKVISDMMVAAAKTPVNQLDVTKYYRLKNYSRNLGLDNLKHPGEGGYMTTTVLNTAPLTCWSQSLHDAGAIWHFVEQGDGSYQIKNLNTGKFVGATAAKHSQYLTMENQELAGTYTLTPYEAIPTQYLLACTNPAAAGVDNLLHPSSDGVMNFNAKAPQEANTPSSWYLVEATELDVKLNEGDVATETWASLYLPFDVTMTEDVKAYAGTLIGDALKLTDAGTTVAANNAVILKGTKKHYVLTMAPATVAPIAGNELQGTNVEIDKIADVFVLGKGAQGVGLYHPLSTETMMKANKAFLPAATAAQCLHFIFGDEATGIEGVETPAEDATAVYYDLSGRRVAQPAHGLYIKNGKKIFVK